MRCPTCQRAHIYHFCSFCMRCHICHFPIAIWSQNLGTGTIFEPNLPFKTGCNKFQMESVKKKKRPSQIYFETATSLSSDIGLLDLAGFYWNIFYNVSLLSFI